VSDEADMERPVTRRELKEELGKLEARFDTKLERLETRLDAKLDFKIDTWGGALLARMDAMRAELIIEMARQTKAAMEWALEQFRDRYADLPRRVARLEGTVFPPKRARRR
jgi:hypothetical protein